MYKDNSLRLLQIIGRCKEGNLIVKGSKTSTFYTINPKDFSNTTTIVADFSIIPN